MRCFGLVVAAVGVLVACSSGPTEGRQPVGGGGGTGSAGVGGAGGAGGPAGTGGTSGTAGSAGLAGSGGVEATPGPFTLTKVAEGFPFVTDLQPVPGQEGVLVVTDNGGAANWLRVADGSRGTFLDLPGIDETKEGLLGLAFHPSFPADRRIFVHYAASDPAGDVLRISQFTVGAGDPLGPAGDEQALIEIPQGLPNHNGGALAFGQDGMLYVAFGDGGTVEHPLASSQDPQSLLGKVLRLDVSRSEGGRPWAIPADNPFVGRGDVRGELFAMGFRNPWRLTFAPDGTLVVADVGADDREEIDLVHGGENYGWNVMEGSGCFPPEAACDPSGFALPFHEYGHADRQPSSITGGHVYTGRRLPALRGQYVFGDFERGTVWAIDLAGDGKAARVLGESHLQLVTFGVDLQGELYLADFASGAIYRLDGIDPLP